MSFSRSLEILSRALGHSLGVTIKTGATLPAYDLTHKTIDLPAFGPSIAEEYPVALGYTALAAFHICFETPDVIYARKDLGHALAQVFEDARVFKLGMCEFPGTVKMVESMVTGLASPPPKNSPLTHVVNDYLVSGCMSELGISGLEKQKDSIADLLKITHPDLLTMLDAVIQRCRDIPSTEASLTLGYAIARYIESCEISDSSADPDNGGSFDPLAFINSVLRETEVPDTDNNNQPGADGKAQFNDGSRSNTAPANKLEIGTDLGEHAIPESILARAEASLQAVVTEQHCCLTDAAPVPVVPYIGEIVHEAQSLTKHLRRRFEQMLKSTAKTRVKHIREGAVLDDRKLPDLIAGEQHVFIHRTKKRQLNTAVMVLLDYSSSMKNTSRFIMAREATLGLMMALDTLPHVKSACAMLPGEMPNGDYRTVGDLVRFNERTSRVADRFDAIFPRADTPIAEALMYAYQQLLSQRVNRRLVILVSDGKPFRFNLPAKRYFEETKKIIRQGELGGIEQYGIGINSPAIAELFPDSASIVELDELPVALFKTLQTALAA